MSLSDIVSIMSILIKVGTEIRARLDSQNEANEDLLLLTTNLQILLKFFEDTENEVIIKTNSSEFVNIVDILQSIAQSCTSCAKALGVEPAGTAPATQKTGMNARKVAKQVWNFHKDSWSC